jgi:hypothetical protein
LGELAAFNKRQQELESRFMQSRIGNQLGKIDSKMVAIAASKNASQMKYLD